MVARLFKNSLVHSGANIVIGIGNWFFGYLIIRYSDLNNLSLFYAFTGILSLFSLAGVWITTMTVRLGHVFREIIVRKIKHHQYIVLLACLLFVGILYTVSVQARLSFMLFILLLFLLLITTIMAYLRGLLQHYLLFGKLAGIGITEVILKLSLLIICNKYGFQSTAMFIALVLQNCVSLIILLMVTRKIPYFAQDYSGTQLKSISILTIFYSLNIIFFANIDSLMARILLTPIDNSDYIASLQIIKLLFFGAAALTGVFLSTINKETNKKLIITSSLITNGLIVTGYLFIVGVVAYKYELITNLFKLTHMTLPNLIIFLSYCLSYALGTIALTILLVRQASVLKHIIIILSVAQLFLYIMFGRTATAFIHIFGIISIATLVLGYTCLAYHAYKQPLSKSE